MAFPHFWETWRGNSDGYEIVTDTCVGFRVTVAVTLLLLQELVEDVAVATSSCHANLSCAHCFAVASPRLVPRSGETPFPLGNTF